MTKSYLYSFETKNQIYKNWEIELIAPRLTIKNFAHEMHYYIRIYIKQEKPFLKLVKFLFLNAVQRIFYTIGAFLSRIDNSGDGA